jgi:hypothetical protein
MGTSDFSLGEEGGSRDVKLTTRPYLVLRLRIALLYPYSLDAKFVRMTVGC